MTGGLGLAHFWEQADGVIRLTAYLLVVMSVASWFLILWKGWAWWRVRRAARAIDSFWSAPSIEVAIAQLKPADTESVFVPLAAGAANAASHPAAENSLAAQIGRSELITRALRQRINEAAGRLEAGLTILASVGSTQQDLLDAVALASTGKLRQVVDRVVPLAQVNETLQALQRGEVAGRAVLQP